MRARTIGGDNKRRFRCFLSENTVRKGHFVFLSDALEEPVSRRVQRVPLLTKSYDYTVPVKRLALGIIRRTVAGRRNRNPRHRLSNSAQVYGRVVYSSRCSRFSFLPTRRRRVGCPTRFGINGNRRNHQPCTVTGSRFVIG